ncbi:hypothetical protein FHS15_003139 [Paenibacillus castaneae]|nr:hypothetical protein [Paenibacillus castaneae]
MKRMGRLFIFSTIMFVFLLGLFPSVTSAHDNDSIAFTDISIKGNVIKFVIQIDMYDIRVEATPENPDVGDKTSEAYDRFVKESHDPVEKYLLSNIELYADDLPLKGKLTQLSQVDKEDQNQPFAEAVLEYPVENSPQKFELDYNLVFERDSYHVNYVNVALGDLKANAVFVSELHELRIGQMSLPYTLEHFFLLGLKHVLTLFESIILIALLIIGRKSVKQLAAALFVFLGIYSLTLILAGLQLLNLPDHFIHSIIALSIFIVSLYTLLSKKKNLYLWLAGGFGFFYGFGYAEGLAGLKSDGGHKIYSVLAYTVGIGAAVSIIALILYLVLHFVLKVKNLFSWILKTLLLFGIVWFIVRAFF